MFTPLQCAIYHKILILFLYDISHCLTKTARTDDYVTLPINPPCKRSKVGPYCLTVKSHFMFCIYQDTEN